MQKILMISLAAALLLTCAGCKARLSGEAGPEETTPAYGDLPRVDGLHNPILTKYAEGSFIKAENGELYLDEKGEEHVFALSARAEKDVQALGFAEGDRMIVNYNILEDGTEEAESLEKILSE